jgi:hypothetical protein
VQVTEMVCEQQTREVTYTVCVPVKKTVSYDVTVCKTVPVEKVRRCTVMVPHQVEKEVQVQVCRMVPKTVTVPVNGGCSSGCAPRGCRHCR